MLRDHPWSGHHGNVTRADRLLALVAELRTGAPDALPAGVLADRLQVSESTVRRDLADLAAAGLPIRHAGSGQGYALAGAEPSVRALGTVASLTGPVRETLDAALRTRRVVRIAYTGSSGARTYRDVEPHGLVIAPYGEYLVGWCRLRRDLRTFRLDRIGAAYLAEREAGPADLDAVLRVLRVPAPRVPPDDGDPAGPAAVAAGRRAGALRRLNEVRARLADLLDDALGRDDRAGAAALRELLAHLSEWTRWQVAALRAVTTGGDLVFDGHRPAFPAAFDRRLPFHERERMIQDVMAVRALPELARDLGAVLDAAAHWAADCDDLLWCEAQPDPAVPGRRRPLAELLTGADSPLSHIEWHLEQAPGAVRPGALHSRRAVQCPLRS